MAVDQKKLERYFAEWLAFLDQRGVVRPVEQDFLDFARESKLAKLKLILAVKAPDQAGVCRLAIRTITMAARQKKKRAVRGWKRSPARQIHFASLLAATFG